MNFKLRNAREEAQLTQSEVAQKALISTMSYQRYEAGERTPNVHTAIRIADLLGVDVKDLFSSLPEKESEC